MSKIFLIGFMGSGKTSVGKRLAELLNFEFIDLDDVVEKNEGKTISEIFEEHGEEYFRDEESVWLKSLSEKENAVIATGGGTPCFYDSMEWMNSNGITIYLKTHTEVLFQRLKSEISHRPLLRAAAKGDLKKFIASKLNERKSFYQRSKIILECSIMNEEEISRQVLTLLS